VTTPNGLHPTTNFSTHQRMSWLIHGFSKKGKSTLAATAPKPVLVLDAEGSWRFIPGRVRYWDPMKETPPEWDGSWDICVVHITEWAQVDMVYRYLTQWVHLQFVSVVIDSITEIQRRCKANLKGTEAMKIQDWGVLLSLMDWTIRGFRDLCLMPQLNVRCVVFVSETMEGQMGRLIPAMQGQIARSLPYWVDVCGFLFVDWDRDANGQATREIRRLQIGPHAQYEAGERVQGRLGTVLNFERPPEGQTGIELEWWMKCVFGVTEAPQATEGILA
jgi:hypothetical protein